MSRPSGVFRLFVSSTFSEFHRERDVLALQIFPRLQRFCLERGQRFQAIDLRWGIRAESELGWRAIELCLREIERCVRIGRKPSFLILQGPGRGTLPAPERIPCGTFERILANVDDAGNRALLDRWYRLDANAQPAHYELLPPPDGPSMRGGAFETQLRHVLARASHAVSMGDSERAKFSYSATEQEIDHYLRFVGGDTTGLLCLRRSEAELSGSHTRGEPWASLPDGCIARYESDEHLTEFARLACERLEKLVAREIESLENKPQWNLDYDVHAALATERGEALVGRDAELSRIASYLNSDEQTPLLVHGEGGLGKTALIARSWLDARDRRDQIVLARFVGAGSSGAAAREVIGSLRAELAARLGIDEQRLIGHESSLQVQLGMLLQQASTETPITIFLDAVDQLPARDAEAAFAWIPNQLPPHARVVVSCLTGPGAELVQRLPHSQVLELQPLMAVHSTALLDRWLALAARQLTSPQRALIAASPSFGIPLYLRTAVVEASSWRSWTSIDTFPETTLELLRQVLTRLNFEHGAALVGACLESLDAARHGLSEDELLDILREDGEVMAEARSRAQHEFPSSALPIVLWTRLYDALQSFLRIEQMPGGQLLGFYHRQLRETIQQLCVDPLRRRERHESLARYFEPSTLEPPVTHLSPVHVRALSELPHQLSHGSTDGIPRLHRRLSEFSFVLAKIAAGLLDELASDYELVSALHDDAVTRWRSFLLRQEHLLRREHASPSYRTLLQLAAESGEASIADAAKIWLDGGHGDWLWLKSNAPASPEERFLERSLDVHAGREVGFAELRQGWTLCFSEAGLWTWNLDSGARRLLDATPTRAALALPDGNVLSLRRDGVVMQWDLRTEQVTSIWADRARFVESLLYVSQTRALVRSGDGCELFDVTAGRRIEFGATRSDRRLWVLGPDAFLGFDSEDELVVWSVVDGSRCCSLRSAGETISALPVGEDRVLTGGSSGSVTLWSRATGEPIWCTLVHQKQVSELVAMRNGKFLSHSWDGSLAVCDVQSGRVERRLQAFTSPIDGALVLPDERVIAWAFEAYLLVWDPSADAPPRKLESRYETLFNDCRLLPGGRVVAWGRLEGRIAVWDIERAQLVASVAAHDAAPVGLLSAGDSRFMTWANDGLARVWNVSRAEAPAILEGHPRRVLGAFELGSDALVTWGEDDPVLRIWSYDRGRCEHELRGHTRAVRTVVVLDDGRIASGSEDATIRVWSPHTGDCLAVLEGHDGPVIGFAVASNAQLVSFGYDRRIMLWDLEHGAYAGRALEGHAHHVFDAVCLREGRLASCSRDGLIVWDLATTKLVSRLQHPEGSGAPVGLLAWDAHRVISRSNAGLVCVWDVENGRLEQQLRETQEFIGGMLRLRGDRVAIWCGDENVPSRDRRVWLWAPNAGLPLVTLEPTDATQRVWDHATGDVVLTRSAAGPHHMCRAWDARSGQCLQELPADRVPSERSEWFSSAGAFAASLHRGRHFGWDADRVVGISSGDGTRVARWQADASTTARSLRACGTLAVTSETGEVRFLQLHFGPRHVGLEFLDAAK